jgi:hypothetical protein
LGIPRATYDKPAYNYWYYDYWHDNDRRPNYHYSHSNNNPRT